MNLIEQLGGYARAIKMSKEWESSIDGDIPLDTMMYSYDFGIFSWGDLQSALLEYRRQHNIFEVGDKVAAIGEDYLSTVMTVERVTGRALECFESGYIFTFQGVRHATPEEIAAGKRL